MGKLVLFMHVSLDGFVAGPNGEMDWIIIDEEIFDYAKRQTDRSDTALHGRVTFELMDNYWPTAGDKPNASKHDKEHSAWYNAVNKIVISRSMKNAALKNTRIISDNLREEILKLKASTESDIVIFGSPGASHALMEEGLIDEYWTFINPILLGQGIPLFKNIRHKTALELVETRIFSSGVIGMHHTVK